MKSEAEVQVAWAKAVLEMQHQGQPKALAELLRSDEPIPLFARHLLARLVEGTLQLPDRRGKTNARLSPGEKEKIEGWLFEAHLNAGIAMVHLDQLADEMQIEPGELRSLIEQRKADTVTKIANHFGLTENTVRQYCSAREITPWAEAFAGVRQIQLGDSEPFDMFPVDQEEIGQKMLVIARGWLLNPDLFPDLTE